MAKPVSARSPLARPQYQTVPVTDLTGGLDLRRTPTLLETQRAQTLLNFSLGEPGALRVRPGWAAFTTSALSTLARPIQGGQRVYLSSTQGTIVGWQGGLYIVRDNATWNSTAVLTGLSTLEQMFFPFDRDLVAVFDSTSTPRKSTDLITWTRLGIAASTVASTLAQSTAATSLSTSEFEVSFTYKDRGLSFESDGAVVSTITLTDTRAIVVTVPNSTDAQVDAIVVYARNKTAGETVLRKFSSAAQSAGVSSTFVIDSSNWSANAEIPTTHGTPPILSFGVVWKNRWWARHATSPTRLHFTEIFTPQGWPALYYIDLPFANGEEIQAIQAQGDTLLILGQSQVFLVIGQTSLDFEVRPSIGAQGGALGPRSVALIEAGVAHASAEGVFIFDGAADTILSHDITPGWRDLIDNAASTALANVPMVYDWREKELRIAVPRLYPYGTRGEWVLDLNRTREQESPAWSQTDRTILGYIFWDGDEPTQGNRGQLQSYPSSLAQMFTESTGTTANGANLTAQYTGPALPAGMNQARFVDLHVEYEPHGGSFTAETVVDRQSQGQITLAIGAGLATYGTSVYGTATYGGVGRRKAYTPLPLGSDGRSVQQSFVYSGQESFAVFTYAIGLVPELAPRQISE